MKTSIFMTMIFATSVVWGQQAPLSKPLQQLQAKPLNKATFLKMGSLLDKQNLEKKAQGGVVNGGGGVTADDGAGKRKLLDLLEKDELEFFLPEKVLKKSDPNGYFAQVSPVAVQMHYFSRYALRLQSNDCKKMPTFERSIWGSNAFLLIVSLSYLPGVDVDPHCEASSYSDLMNYVYQSLKIKPVEQLRWAFTEDDLENLNDEGVILIANPKTKRQLAVQQGTLVVISKKEFMLLDEESKQALFIHESILRAVLSLNPQHIEKYGTQYVREYVRKSMKLFKDGEETVPVETVIDAFKKFEINN